MREKATYARTHPIEPAGSANCGKSFSRVRLQSCRNVLAGINNAKASILAEARQTWNPDERLLHLALNEAEALAWQTGYPHLLFPALAAEKIQAVADWSRRQDAIWRPEEPLALAA